MKWNKKIMVCILGATMLLSLGSPEGIRAETPNQKQVDVVFTHDTHSHLNSFTTLFHGERTEIGGFARLDTMIQEQKTQNPDTLVLDAGDFSMGTLIQTVFEEEAPELRMLGALEYDVTTLGNHEFDYRSQGLANMLEAAVSSGDPLPSIVLCNVDWERMEAEGLTNDQEILKKAFTDANIQDYVVLEKGEVTIAVLGVFGIDSLACAPTCSLLFQDPVAAVKETVAEIKDQEDVDMIICVSHGGTTDKEDTSEDEILAKEVPELDLIISGHSHTELEEPIIHGDTYIVSAGEYGEQLGTISLEQKDNGRWQEESYTLQPVTSDIKADSQTQEKIDSFMAAVDSDYLADFGYQRDQILAENEVEFCSVDDLYEIHEELNLGDYISDAYRYAVENSTDYNGVSVDMAVVPSGTIRDTYTVGDITVEDVYNSFSLGIGADGVPGYPLIDIYLTGAELKLLAEVDASISDLMPSARLYMSGMNMTYNPNRLILNKVTDIYLEKEDGSTAHLEDEKLYRVIADLYSGQMLGAVTDMSYGLLAIVPKKADGTPVDNFEDVIIYENGHELKAWDAIARYTNSFSDTDGNGIGNVPEYYSTTHQRKVVDDSKNIMKLMKNPNKYAGMIIGAIVGLAVLLILILVLLVKIVKFLRKKKNKPGNGK